MATFIVEIGEYVPLLINGNDDFDITVIHQDEDGVVIDLTGYQLTWQFSTHGITIELTVGSGLTVTAVQGKIVAHIDDSDVADLPEGLGTHRLFTTAPATKTLIRGALVNDRQIIPPPPAP
jgi:hypothetical protein